MTYDFEKLCGKLIKDIKILEGKRKATETRIYTTENAHVKTKAEYLLIDINNDLNRLYDILSTVYKYAKGR